MIKFTVPAVPIAQPRPQPVKIGNRAGMANVPKKHPVHAFKATVRLAAEKVYHGAPLEGPLRVDVTFVLPRRRVRIWKSKPMPREWHDRKPDKDNLEKSVYDALTGLLWRDDSQICCGYVEKWEASGDEQPCVEIVVSRCKE